MFAWRGPSPPRGPRGRASAGGRTGRVDERIQFTCRPYRPAPRRRTAPYGYAITVWSTTAALAAEHGTPSLLEIDLFASGAMAAYGGLTFLTWATSERRPSADAQPAPRLRGSAARRIHVSSLEVALVEGERTPENRRVAPCAGRGQRAWPRSDCGGRRCHTGDVRAAVPPFGPVPLLDTAGAALRRALKIPMIRTPDGCLQPSAPPPALSEVRLPGVASPVEPDVHVVAVVHWIRERVGSVPVSVEGIDQLGRLARDRQPDELDRELPARADAAAITRLAIDGGDVDGPPEGVVGDPSRCGVEGVV